MQCRPVLRSAATTPQVCAAKSYAPLLIIAGVTSTKTILYGHALQLLHVGSGKYLSCLGLLTSILMSHAHNPAGRTGSGALALALGLEASAETSSWFRIRGASNTRTDGEKVRGNACKMAC